MSVSLVGCMMLILVEDMGQIVVPYDFAHRGEMSSAKWYPLQKRRAMKEVKGSLRVSIRLVESVAIPQQEVKKSTAKVITIHQAHLTTVNPSLLMIGSTTIYRSIEWLACWLRRRRRI